MELPNWSAPKVSRDVLLGHHWAFTVFTLCLVAFRVGISLKYHRRIWLDDGLIIATWLMILASNILDQVEATNLYNSYPLVTGKIPETPQNLRNEVSVLRAWVADFALAYTELFFIKLSILFFLKRLFYHTLQQTTWLKTWWWFVLGWVVASWAVCIGTIPFNCMIKPLPFILKYCAVPSGISYFWINLQLSCATDIVSDVFVIVIPIAALWNVKIHAKKKVMLMGILSSTILTMVCAVIRIGVMPDKNSSADPTWLCLWAHVEITFAVLVSSLASFRQLFIKSNNTSSYDDKPFISSSNPSTKQSWRKFRNIIPTLNSADDSLGSKLSSQSTQVNEPQEKNTSSYIVVSEDN